jgi:hypothetical protein
LGERELQLDGGDLDGGTTDVLPGGLVPIALLVAFDDVILDREEAGLDHPSAIRSYFGMALARNVDVIGTLSDRDFVAFKRCLGPVLAT